MLSLPRVAQPRPPLLCAKSALEESARGCGAFCVLPRQEQRPALLAGSGHTRNTRGAYSKKKDILRRRSSMPIRRNSPQEMQGSAWAWLV